MKKLSEMAWGEVGYVTAHDFKRSVTDGWFLPKSTEARSEPGGSAQIRIERGYGAIMATRPKFEIVARRRDLRVEALNMYPVLWVDK